MKFFLHFIKDHKLILLVSVFYFVFRLINLTKAPLFNDEAIYLDWGFREIHKPGFLYYSLYDGKAPFLMWIFGILESFFSPAFSGRIVSVFAGFITLIGLYKISKVFFDRNVALLSAFLYAIIPIFSFYDRQALMESSIAAVGVWSFYFLANFFKSNNYKESIYLGLILGIGFFVKNSSFIFFITIALSIIFHLIYKNKKSNLINKTFVLLLSFFLSIFLLIINPQFWSTLGGNDRFILPLKELLSLPINIWVTNLVINLQISFFYLTPLFFIFCILGIILFLKNEKNLLLIYYFLTSLLLETITIKSASQRYIEAFLPLTIIFVSYLFFYLFKNYKKFTKFAFLILISFPLLLSILQIESQSNYLLFMGKLTKYNNGEYLNSFTSGYGVDSAIDYIKNYSNGADISVGFAENTGNPESAIIAQFARDKHIQAAYLDSKLIGIDISSYKCLDVSKPLIFVARDSQQGGLDNFLQKIKTIKNPYGENKIGIYELKPNCKGKTLYLSPKYNST